VITIKNIEIGKNKPLALIAGPCQIESAAHAQTMAGSIKEIADKLGIPFIYKSSFDKANRTSIAGSRGVGLSQGADILQEVRERFGVNTLTDVHETWQCEQLKHSVDVLQIPAFLCRQTDLLLAAGAAVHSVNIKKGQFLAPWDMKNVIDKLPDNDVWITERGSSFGYNTLVVDYRGLVTMRTWGRPVIFDATHSVQQPGGRGSSSGGQREFILPLARAACAVGVDGLFMETHNNPDQALSDAATQIPVCDLRQTLQNVLSLQSA
jgi:2-dehydro-3-deoxyphosphooctonate aldolase (KDO 8-P synthase)